MSQNKISKVINGINSIIKETDKKITRTQIYEKLVYKGIVKPNTKKEFDEIVRIAIDHKEVDKDKIKTTKPKSTRLPNVLRIKQIKKIVNEITSVRDMIVFLTSFFAGLRVGETSKLKNTDLFLDDPNVTYIKVVQGKRSKDRFVTLPKAFVDILKLWLEYIEEYESPYIIPTDSSMNPIDKNYLNTRFKMWCEEANILKVEYVDKRGFNRYNYHMHSMRHSYATFRLETGDSPQNVMHELGHQDLETLQIYSHISLESRQRHTNKVFGYGRELPNLITVPRQESEAISYESGQLELKKKQLEIEEKRLEIEKLKLMKEVGHFQIEKTEK